MNNILDVFTSQFKNVWINLKSSLWFVPSVIVFLFSITAMILIEVDVVYNDVIKNNTQVFGTSAEGARGILTTIAASMITVAGVVFSITIVALSLTSSQYSSRVLRNFMRDRKNQLVLGVFIGIFAYCLIVLRTVRGPADPVFVPELSVFFGVILSFTGIAVFVFFIHHIASSIQASQIISNIFNETMQIIDELYPEEINEEKEKENTSEKQKWKEADGFNTINSDKSGYVQKIDKELLLKLAKEHDIIIRVEIQVGAFVVKSTPFISYRGETDKDKDITKLIRKGLSIELQRTIEQDPAYGIRQLVDVALKALSPGINDTTTAVMSIERLTAILCTLACRNISDSICYYNKKVKVIIEEPDFDYYMDEAFGQIPHHGSNNIVILNKLSWALKLIKSFISTDSQRDAIIRHSKALCETIDSGVLSASQKQPLLQLCRKI